MRSSEAVPLLESSLTHTGPKESPLGTDARTETRANGRIYSHIVVPAGIPVRFELAREEGAKG